MHRTHPTALELPRIKMEHPATVVIHYKVQQTFAAHLLEPRWQPEWHRLPPRESDWGRPSLSALMGPTGIVLYLKVGQDAIAAEGCGDFLSSSSHTSDYDTSSESE